MLLDEPRAQVARAKVWVVEDRAVIRDGRRGADDDELAERTPGAGDRIGAVAPQDDQLRHERVVVGRDVGAGAKPESTRTPGPAGATHRTMRFGLGMNLRSGSSALMRISMAWPFDSTSVCSKLSSRPAATRICSLTRSMPVTASVLGCSTCSRRLTSRK